MKQTINNRETSRKGRVALTAILLLTPASTRGDGLVLPIGIAEKSPGISLTAVSDTDEVPLEQTGGVFVIPVRINGTITLPFVIDSGAADVQIPVDVFSTLARAGTIVSSDIIGKRRYRLANGSAQDEPRFIVRELRVGSRILRDVPASVSPFRGELLLGQSFLSRFAEWTLDNERHVLKLVEKSAASPKGPAEQPTDAGPTATVMAPPEQPGPTLATLTALVCGRTVDYQIHRSGAATGLLGVWTGHWNNSSRLCGGLIIEKIDPQGAADIIYVYGPSQPGGRLSWNAQRRTGVLSNGALSFRDDQGSIYTFYAAGVGALGARFASRSGRLDGLFQKIR